MKPKKLVAQKCVPCEGRMRPLSGMSILPYLAELPDWKVVNGRKIEREFQFQDFKTALKFINTIAGIAEKEGHHPDMFLHNWNKVTVMLSTHAISGLSKNDFILAAKVSALVPNKRKK